MSGCRISRVRYKDGRDLRILPTVIQDSRFIRTMVYVLDQARRGDVRSFAVIFRMEQPDGTMKWIEAADVHPDADGVDYTMLMGGIERMKISLDKRAGADGATDYYPAV